MPRPKRLCPWPADKEADGISAAASQSRSWTWVGLGLTFVGLPLLLFTYRQLVPRPAAAGPVILREIAIFAMVGLLLWIVTSREKLPLSSIGLKWDRPGRSLAWGIALTLMCAVGIAVLLTAFHLFRVRQGPGGLIGMSLWTATLTIVRAGIAEEVMYRGFAIERIEALTGSRWIAALVPLVAFAVFHYRQGWTGIAIAFVVGAILTAFYLWKRDLVANIVAHFLVDIVPNVLFPLLGWKL
jgi:membrane protease YdiL (CAAX protease family)